MTSMNVPEAIFDRLVAMRREIHRRPELAWSESDTAKRVCARLDELGIAWRSAGGTGVVAELPGQTAGPAVALRADMDALPIDERTDLPFASENEGVMHACGHDGHTAMLLGAAELLATETLAAPVRLLFQPAEEVGMGAVALMEAGALEGVGIVFGGHLDTCLPAGTMAVTEGVVNASTDGFRITVEGREGHAARPHQAIDAIVAASHVVVALQTVVAREVDPAQPAVVTIGRVEAGRAQNVIAGAQRLEHRQRRRRSGRECNASCSAFQRRQTFFQVITIGIGIARVNVTARKGAVGITLESRRQMNRWCDGSGSGIHVQAGMHGQRLESHTHSR